MTSESAFSWPGPVIASYYTLSGAPIRQPSRHSLAARLEAATRAGFSGIGMSVADYRRLQATAGRVEAPASGAKTAEIEMLLDWNADDHEPQAQALFRSDEATAVEIALTHGARSVNAGVRATKEMGLDLASTAERYAALCDRLAPHGLTVALEFHPWSALTTLRDALHVVTAAARPNGGILIDSWHYFRGPNDNATLAQAAPYIVSVQVDDAPKDSLPDLFQDSVTRRLPPGEGISPNGEIDVADRDTEQVDQ